MRLKTVLNSGKNRCILIGVLHQMESTLKVIEVKKCKNKYTIFINKFYFGGLPPQIFINSVLITSLLGSLTLLTLTITLTITLTMTLTKQC